MDNKPSVIIYDLDGTIIDSSSIVRSILSQLRVEYGLSANLPENFEPYLSMGGVDMVSGALGIPASVAQEQLDIFREIYFDTPTDLASIYPFALDTMSKALTAGIRLCLFTNKPRQLVDKIIKELRIEQFFEVSLAGGDLNTRKPHPNNIFWCLTSLKISAQETILIGDSTVDQRSASAASIPFWFFSGGYDDGIDLNTVDQYFDCHSKLPEILGLPG